MENKTVDWKCSIYISVPKKRRYWRLQQLSDHCIDFSGKSIKILWQRLLPYMEWEMPGILDGFRKKRNTRAHSENLCWLLEHMREFLLAPKFIGYVYHEKLRLAFKEMGFFWCTMCTPDKRLLLGQNTEKQNDFQLPKESDNVVCYLPISSTCMQNI